MTRPSATRACWCGNADLTAFSTDYAVCGVCETLVALSGLTAEQAQVNDDDSDFYGKWYWLDHQTCDLGLPDIHARARSDLTERNLHWLRVLLKYRPPPGRVLDLGCSAGSFVALLNQAGYDASGIELSPWVADLGRRTFNVPIAVGPVETLDIPAGSIDVIAMMDVLEHLSDPLATMTHCATLLKPDGLLLIQTPQYPDDIDYAALCERNDPFLEMLQADEHLYLFSRSSVGRLLRQIGAPHARFEAAIFGQYDMFFAASRSPLATPGDGENKESLLRTPHGRLALALLDVREREIDLIDRLQQSDADRTARAEQIETLQELLNTAEMDRAARGEQNVTLHALLDTAETDRAARGEQIVTLHELLHTAETDRAARGEQIRTLGKLLEASEAEGNARAAEIESLARLLKESEESRNALQQAVATLMARPSFRLASRFARWREVAQLRGWSKRNNAR